MTDSQQTSQNLKIFSLVRLRPECKVPPVRVDFSTPHRYHLGDLGPTTLPSRLFRASTPTDSTSLLASFSLTTRYCSPLTQKYYSDNAAYEKYQFEEKKQRSLLSEDPSAASGTPSPLIVAVPHSRYCQLCNQNYENYHTHISSSSHLTRLRHSPANTFILELSNPSPVSGSGSTVGNPRKHQQIKK